MIISRRYVMEKMIFIDAHSFKDNSEDIYAKSPVIYQDDDPNEMHQKYNNVLVY
jgi:hypothetical protein